MRRILATSACILGVLVMSCPPQALASPLPSGFTNQDVNALVALEATQNDLVILAHRANQLVPAQFLGMWTGTVTSDGWALAFSGHVNGISASINQVGALDLPGGKATWTDSGLFGSTPFTGSGTFEIDPSWSYLGFAALVVGAQIFAAPGGAGTALVSGVLLLLPAENAEAHEDVTSQVKPTGSGSATLSSVARLSMSNLQPDPLSSQVFVQRGRLDLSTGAASFESTVVPEPSALFLLGTGLGILLAYGRRYGKRMSDDKSRGGFKSEAQQLKKVDWTPGFSP